MHAAFDKVDANSRYGRQCRLHFPGGRHYARGRSAALPSWHREDHRRRGDPFPSAGPACGRAGSANGTTVSAEVVARYPAGGGGPGHCRRTRPLADVTVWHDSRSARGSCASSSGVIDISCFPRSGISFSHHATRRAVRARRRTIPATSSPSENVNSRRCNEPSPASAIGQIESGANGVRGRQHRRRR